MNGPRRYQIDYSLLLKQLFSQRIIGKKNCKSREMINFEDDNNYISEAK